MSSGPGRAGLAQKLRAGLEADGHTVHTAGDGLTGLKLARLFRYDAMVLDLLLPRLNGYQVCARLRRTGSTLPVLMLTAKEFAVLECLARLPGRAVAKSEILDEVWDRGHDGDVNIVEVSIGGLRRKLDARRGRRVIETVRGAGCRMAPDA